MTGTTIYQVVIMECAAYSYDEFGPFLSKKAAQKAIENRHPDIGDNDSERYAIIVQINLGKFLDEENNEELE